MFYQNILTEITPYQVKYGNFFGFGEHRHGDIEFHYCMRGSFRATVDKKTYTVNAGDLLLISPMAAHAFPYGDEEPATVLTVIVGVSFLKKFFSYFSCAKQKHYLMPSVKDSSSHQALHAHLTEIAEYCGREDETSELLIRGNLYKICAYLIEAINTFGEAQSSKTKEIKKISNIEKALEMIYYHHREPLTVKDAAEATGYGKSNFCKIFKSITGDTFHNVLNRQRIESACGLLSETDMPISQISTEVGFEETKSFCRVFKSVTALTPGEYRKSRK